MKNSRTMPQFNVRIPTELVEFVRLNAAKNFRSMNAEIVYALTQHQQAQEKAPTAVTVEAHESTQPQSKGDFNE